MIKSLINKVSSAISTPESGGVNGADRAAALRLATAVLMIDVARADHVIRTLNDGDRVVTAGISRIHEGLKVTLLESLGD